MSIAPMKKLTLFVCESDSGAIVSELMKLRCVEVSRSEDIGFPACDHSAAIAELVSKISRIRAAIAPLTKYSVRKFSFVKPKIQADTDRFVADGDYDRAWKTVGEVEAALSGGFDASNEKKEAEESAAALAPWSDSVLPLSFTGTAKTSLTRGSLPANTDISGLALRLAECFTDITAVSSDAGAVYAEILTLRGYEDCAGRVLASEGFVAVSLPVSRMTPRMLVTAERKRARNAAEREKEYDTQIRSLAADIDKLRILCDIESTRLEALRKREMMVSTGRVDLLTGWIPEKNTARLDSILENYSCAYEYSDPLPDDDTPVKLTNNRFARNFEWVVELYSLPKYGTYDPTFIMAICYCVLFGMMFADVGYGLIMMAAGLLIPRFLKLTPWADGFFRSFGLCGIVCCIMGVLFGGYFGDFPIQFGRNMLGMTGLPDSLAVVADPILDSLAFMAIGIGAGALHIIVGMAIKFNIIRKNQSLLDAIFDVGLWWVLFAGLALTFLVPAVGKWVLLAGAAGIFLTGGRHEKNWLMKPLKGLLKFYDIIGYASDLLSYARILALGLTSAVIAQVVNILGTMAGPSPLGFVILVIAFIFGHALNIGLNVMGTFVHAARLQYVEFFSKFYESGGKKFEPLSPVCEFTEAQNSIQ